MSDKPIALIIDDEADLCRLMQITLNKMGVDTHVAYDVAGAKAFLASNHYDFCLTDLALPDGSGMEIVELITSTTHTPVAVITAHGNVDTAIEAMKIGAFDFVNKPLDLPRLRQLAQSALKVNDGITPKTEVESDKPAPPKTPQNPIAEVLATPTPKDKPAQPKQTSEPTIMIGDEAFEGRLIGHSRPMKQLRATIKKLARSQAPVFLWGASGTGKEVVSRLIHDLSPRRNGSFVPVNCGAIPSELMESEFFGHKKGSFTGATSDKIGLFQQADGGTLFLDEVADLPLAMQVKLLRAIQEKTVRAIGDTKEVPVDIRIVCATHKDLADLVQKGSFRQDLFYRINVIEVKLPALNERRDDIPMLAKHFLTLIAKDWGLSGLTLTEDAIDVLAHHNFKGNVRELRNILERAVTMSDGDEIDSHHLMLDDTPAELELSLATLEPTQDNEFDLLDVDNTDDNEHDLEILTHAIYPATSTKTSPYYDQRTHYTGAVVAENKTAPITQGLHINGSANYGTPLGTPKAEPSDNKTTNGNGNGKTLPSEGLEAYLLEQERQLICAALQRAGGNKTQAAKLLGMSFRSLRYRMKKLEIDSGDDGDFDMSEE